MHTNNNSINIYNSKYILLFYFLFIFLAYSPVMLFNYAFSDDWATLSNVFQGEGSPFQWDMQSGRPLYAIARHFGFMMVHGINDLTYLRLFSVITILILCCYLFYFINKRNIFCTNITKIIFPLLICFIPAMQVYSAWATCFPFTLSILLAGISYSTLIPIDKKTTIVRFFLSIVVLWLAFSIYQPAAMSFLFFVMLDNCIKQDKKISIFSLSISAIVIFIGMLGSFVLSKFLPVWLYGSSFPRSVLTDDIHGKISWFIHEPLLNAINNFNIDPNPKFTSISIVFALIGIITISKGSSGAIKLFIFICMAIGSYIPNLVIKESWAAFRSLVALELFACTIVILGVFTLVEKLKIVTQAIPIFLILIIISASYNIVSGFVIPQKSELISLATDISDHVDKNFTGRLMFDITKPAYNAFSSTQRYDEFGNISLAAPWAIKGMAEQIKIKKSMNFNLKDDAILVSPSQCITDCIIIKTGDAMRKATSEY